MDEEYNRMMARMMGELCRTLNLIAVDAQNRYGFEMMLDAWALNMGLICKCAGNPAAARERALHMIDIKMMEKPVPNPPNPGDDELAKRRAKKTTT
jgi:hypothetical protein